MSKVIYMLAFSVAAMCAFAFLAGCERGASSAAKQSKDVSRVNDEAYQKQLKGHVETRRRTQAARETIKARMAQLRELARKALPEGATPAQLEAELENNPGKYPAWRELSAALKGNDAEMERNREAAVSAVRQRIRREVAEQAKK